MSDDRFTSSIRIDPEDNGDILGALITAMAAAKERYAELVERVVRLEHKVDTLEHENQLLREAVTIE